MSSLPKEGIFKLGTERPTQKDLDEESSEPQGGGHLGVFKKQKRSPCFWSAVSWRRVTGDGVETWQALDH